MGRETGLETGTGWEWAGSGEGWAVSGVGGVGRGGSASGSRSGVRGVRVDMPEHLFELVDRVLVVFPRSLSLVIKHSHRHASQILV